MDKLSATLDKTNNKYETTEVQVDARRRDRNGDKEVVVDLGIRYTHHGDPDPKEVSEISICDATLPLSGSAMDVIFDYRLEVIECYLYSAGYIKLAMKKKLDIKQSLKLTSIRTIRC